MVRYLINLLVNINVIYDGYMWVARYFTWCVKQVPIYAVLARYRKGDVSRYFIWSDRIRNEIFKLIKYDEAWCD